MLEIDLYKLHYVLVAGKYYFCYLLAYKQITSDIINICRICRFSPQPINTEPLICKSSAV